MTQALSLRRMERSDVEQVMEIEQVIYPYPWSAGNFTDSIDSDYVCVVADLEGEMVGYAVLMLALDEAHLLTIGIAAQHQRRGLGRELLGRMMARAQALGVQRILLEVRASNLPAYTLYQRSGFREIGLRRGYYPAEQGREDALVMECVL